MRNVHRPTLANPFLLGLLRKHLLLPAVVQLMDENAFLKRKLVGLGDQQYVTEVHGSSGSKKAE